MRKDLQGEVTVERSLRKIKGVSFMLARAIRLRSGIPKEVKLGDLTDEQMSSLAKVLETPAKFNLPQWLLNRRRDPVTGQSSHILESDLDFAQREDIQRVKRIRSYKGIRHIYGLKVRGQRTRTTGRKGGTLGVTKKKAGAPQPSAAGPKPAPAAKPAAGAKKEEGKK